ncbi:class I adenylate-forming enzyme family protein [Mycolicibacterium sp. 050158]|uniref:class I adenylate-forming enzyme family protein n=1 Tax=Mycolicibacterium sp. 050158 TaxID=3090602 RepID=UPI00299E4436|nr:class I adenylate-forming enzyme family protein [Mycolicibacterium sp. 050158]MDX1888913.1 class I adenylate-forming enzyme family protein [Mycolicibacterium sp. 050158]
MGTTQDIDARRQALRDALPEWRPTTLHGRLDASSATHGDRPLVISDEATLTYRDVVRQSRCLARGLRGLGVEPGDRVGLVMANHPEFVTLKFAISRAGAIAVPFNYLYGRDELAFVLADSGCRVVITMTGFANLDYQGMFDCFAPGWDRPGFANRAGQDRDVVPLLRHVVVLDTDGRVRPGVRTVADVAALGAAASGADEVDPTSPEDAADMLYTSGTTGTPKGVVTTHDAVLRTAYASALTRAYEDGRRILFSLPCYHMFGYVEGLLSVLYVGGAIIPLTSFDPELYFASIERHRATDMLCVPTMAVAMVESPSRPSYDLSSLTALLCGSAPAPGWLWPRIAEDFGVCEIVTGYGMTECGGAMTLTRPEDPLHMTTETAGRPKMAGAAAVSGSDELVVYKTVDPVTGADLPAGEEGELVSWGPTIMRGFWNRPEQTAAALRDQWLHSGDLGVVRSDGYVRITGRSKELYKSGGELVMPREIEDLLARHDEISQVFVIGLVDDRWGEIGCAVVVRAPGSTLTEMDVMTLCRENLAKFKVPKRVVFVDADDLPKTPTGKVQKFRLVELVAEASAGD